MKKRRSFLYNVGVVTGFTIVAVLSIVSGILLLIGKTGLKTIHYLALKSKIYERDPLDELKIRRIN